MAHGPRRRVAPFPNRITAIQLGINRTGSSHMKFYGYFRSSAAWRCRIAFNLKGISPEYVPVHLVRDGGGQHRPEYRALNPQELVPALATDDALLTQSLAIVEWLEETVREPPLLPEQPVLRAKVRAFALAIACDIHPLQNLRVLNYLRAEFGQDQEGVERWCRRWIGDGLAACETMLAREPRHGDFCFGETPGLADLCLVPQLFSARRFKADVSRFSRLLEVEAACEKLPAFAAAHPSRQPDSET